MFFKTGLILNCTRKNQVKDFFRQLFIVIYLYLSIQDPADSLKSNVLSIILKRTNLILLPLNFSSNFVPCLIMLIKGKTWLTWKNLDLSITSAQSKVVLQWKFLKNSTTSEAYQKQHLDRKLDLNNRSKIQVVYKASDH